MEMQLDGLIFNWNIEFFNFRLLKSKFECQIGKIVSDLFIQLVRVIISPLESSHEVITLNLEDQI